ncbi:ligand-binding sensor domain-containing protein [Larkinella terrae]|uniref:ligand-binding sensor domain-containing protein n=1 Tax=Larkinella terrae TaxID=2025311 RepID=UPI0014783EEA|nr:HAMP domain-containing sensor histidine kinase [Larkinella terrae]
MQAQSQFSMVQYTAENGLPQNSIKGISQDSYGFVWLATEDGLVRFDGHQFRVFNHFNLPVRLNRMYRLRPAVRDQTAPGTGRNRVSYGLFLENEHIKLENGTAVLDTTWWPSRLNWFRSLGVGRSDYLEAQNIPDMLGELVGGIKRYLLVAGTTSSDYYFWENNWVRYYQHGKKQAQFFFPTATPLHFFVLGKRLYYYQDSGRILAFRRHQSQQSVLSGDILNDPVYTAHPQACQLYWSSNSDQAFLYLHKKLYTLQPEADGNFVTRLLIDGFDFEAQAIVHVHFDPTSQKVYLGSLTEGFFVLTRHQFQTLTIRGTPRENSLYAQLPYNAHAVLTPTGRIIGLDPRTGQPIEQHVSAIRRVNPDDDRVSLRDHRGTLWLRHFQSLFHFDARQEKIISHWTLSERGNVEALHQIKDGPIWIGIDGHGLYKLDPTNPRARLERVGKDSLTDITCMTHQSDDALLVGTHSGLYRLTISTRNLERIPGTEGVYIKSIHRFANNRIWLTALDKGIMLLGKNDQIISFPLDKNAYLASPHCIVDDHRGFFWIPTNRGLFQIAIQDLLRYSAWQPEALPSQPASHPDLFYLYHAKEEGFKTNEFNGNCLPCAAKLSNGYISLPSLVGLVWFKPETIRPDLPNSPIILDQIELNNTVLKTTGDTLQLPPDFKNIWFFFATPYAGNPYNLKLSYALVKAGSTLVASDWQPLDPEDFSVRYLSLESGTYRLLVRKLNGFGHPTYTRKELVLIIEPVWYETGWASVFFAVLLLLSGYGISLYRVRLVQRENARLERLVARRTDELNATLDELNATLQELKGSEAKMTDQLHIMSRLLASITHDIQSPLQYVALASESIPELLQQDKLANAASLGTIISDLTHKMRTMLKDLLDYMKIQVYGKRLNWDDINLRTLVDRKLALFKPLMEQNGCQASNEVAPALAIRSDYQLLSIILHNLLDNAAKFTHQGRIRIESQVDAEGRVELVISNTGKSLSAEVIDLMNSQDKTEHIDPTLKQNRSLGLGLLIAKEVAELLAIELSVDQTHEVHFHLLFEATVSLAGVTDQCD